MNKILKIVSCVITVGIIATVTIGGKFHVGTSSATLNGESVITGSPFRLSGGPDGVSVFYQAILGSSTPHYKIGFYTSPDNSSYTTNPIATLTPSADETTTDFMHRVATSTAGVPWARIDVLGSKLNAEDTTFNLWIYEK